MTTIALTSFITQMQNLVPDISTSELSTLNLHHTAKQAITSYSLLFADEVTEDITGDGGKYYPISSLTSWATEFSRVLSVQFPAPTVASDETPTYLGPEDWDAKYFDGTTQYIYFPNHSPTAPDAFRVKYTAPYKWTSTSGAATAVNQTTHGFSLNDAVYLDSSGTWVSPESLDLLGTHQVTTVTDADNFTATGLTADIPEMDFFAICYKGACLLCLEIAAKYSRTSDSTINADSVDHPSRASEFEARAKAFCAKFSDAMGLRVGGDDGDSLQPAVAPYSEFADWDNSPAWPEGRRFIFHR